MAGGAQRGKVKEEHGRAGVVAPALWVLLSILVVAGGWSFLQACALGALTYCPVPADHRALLAAVEQGTELDREVHQAEMAIAEKPICTPPHPASVPARQPDEMDRKLIERGGKNGVLQFTLEWATLDDLDLNVNCPGGRLDGRVDHRGPGICGDGRKDLDANRNLRENVSRTPIENIVWQHDIPEGTYQIEVNEFLATTNQGNRVPFTLRIRSGSQEKVCRSFVSTLPLSERLMDGDKIIGGTYQTLTIIYDEPLPDCNFESHYSHRGGGK